MKKMIIMTGLQASGKSSFCRSRLKDFEHISLDELHTRNKERIAVEDCIARGADLVIDNTNPTADERRRYIEIAENSGYEIIGCYMKSVLAECLERNERREGRAKIPRTAIAGTSKKIELPSYSEGFHKLYYVEMSGGGFKISDWQEEPQSAGAGDKNGTVL